MRVLSAVAKVALVVGTVGSVGLMLRVGGHKTSGILLLLLFGVWVIAPFVGLAWIGQIARHWPERSQAMLCGLTLAIAVSSLAIYGEAAFGPPQPKPADGSSWLVAGDCGFCGGGSDWFETRARIGDCGIA